MSRIAADASLCFCHDSPENAAAAEADFVGMTESAFVLAKYVKTKTFSHQNCNLVKTKTSFLLFKVKRCSH